MSVNHLGSDWDADWDSDWGPWQPDPGVRGDIVASLQVNPAVGSAVNISFNPDGRASISLVPETGNAAKPTRQQ